MRCFFNGFKNTIFNGAGVFFFDLIRTHKLKKLRRDLKPRTDLNQPAGGVPV